MNSRKRLSVLCAAIVLQMMTARLVAAEEKRQRLSGVEVYNYVIGTQTFAATYQFSGEAKLVETARAIQDMGSTVLKFGMGPDSYSNSPSRSPDIRTLKNLASLDASTKQVLDMPFANFVIWVSPMSVDGDHEKIFLPERLPVEYAEIYALSRHLLATYAGTGKAFYLGHWEGDWLLTHTNPEYVPTPDEVERMIDWINIRQKAVDDAKRDTPGDGVNVYCYLEVNRVVDAMQGKVRVTNAVLPKTHVDFVSYSAYDVISPWRDRLEEALDYIQSHLPPKPGIPGKRVFIGEYGFPAGKYTPQEQDEHARHVMRTGLAWGCPFVLYWEMYNNEVWDGKQAGYWIIDDHNVRQPVYYTHQYFYEKARRFVASYHETHSRWPSREEFAREATAWLAIPGEK